MTAPRPVCRLLPYAVADGPHNMAADEVVLETALAGTASLRFYGWTTATVSLGYFQEERVCQQDAQLARLPRVRRPSGGGTLVHHHEITYAFGLPPGPPWQGGESWLLQMHTIIAAALARVGIAVHPQRRDEERPFHGFLCFQHFTSGDLLIGSGKVTGSAQRRQRRALLQHGSILLAASPHSPMLPGIRELTGHTLAVPETCHALEEEWTRQTSWFLGPADWTDNERQRLEEVAATKYSQDCWNAKR